MVSAGATCCFRPTNAGSCRTVPARTTQCHRVRSPHAAHRSCPIVTGRHIPTSADTRRYRTAHPGTARHDPTLPVPGRTIRDLLRAPAGRPRPPRQQAAPSGPHRQPSTPGDTHRHLPALHSLTVRRLAARPSTVRRGRAYRVVDRDGSIWVHVAQAPSIFDVAVLSAPEGLVRERRLSVARPRSSPRTRTRHSDALCEPNGLAAYFFPADSSANTRGTGI